WKAIPEDVRQSIAYTVDFVADRNERVWLLEMNCNPTIHPDIYADILEDLLGSAKNTDASQGAPSRIPIPEGAPLPASLTGYGAQAAGPMGAPFTVHGTPVPVFNPPPPPAPQQPALTLPSAPPRMP